MINSNKIDCDDKNLLIRNNCELMKNESLQVWDNSFFSSSTLVDIGSIVSGGRFDRIELFDFSIIFSK